MAGLAYAPEARMLVPAGDPATAWTVILDPSAVATARTALSINAGAIAISQDGIDWGQAAIDAYEAALQKWGSTVVDFRVPNRLVTINLLVGADNSGESGFYDAAMALRQKVALFQREGGWIQRGFDVPMYADIVSAALTFADQYGETGFLESNVILTLECLPDFYGDEITLDTISFTGYCEAVLQQGGVQAVIEGDHPGRCRIVVTQTAGGSSVAQDQITWGFRSRHYDAAASAKLFIEAENTISAGAISDSNAYNGHAISYVSAVNNVWVDALFTADLSGNERTHKGTYRVLARCSTNVADTPLRLIWGPPDAQITNAQVGIDAIISFGQYQIVDLGVISLQPGPLTPWSWSGIVQAFVQTSTEVRIDCLWLQPLDESAGLVPAVALGGFSASSTEIRTEGIFRTTGATWEKIPSQGDLPRIPPSGLENRPVELLLKPSRGDINGDEDGGIDPFAVQVRYRPSYVFRP